MTTKTTNGIAPRIQDDGELFPVAYPKRSASVSLTYHGVPIALTVNDAPLAELEKLIDGLIARDGWSAAPRPRESPQDERKAHKATSARLEPLYNDEGEPCCPTHKRPLKQGRFGLFCPAKDEGGRNGYCDLKFAE